MRASLIIGAFGMLPLTLASTAFAQTTGRPEKEISFDLSGTYEDNFARSSEALAQLRGLQRSDFLISPSVGIKLSRPVGLAQVEVEGKLGYVFHAKNDDLNRERLSLRTSAAVPLGPCGINPRAEIQRRQSDLRDIVFLAGPNPGNPKNTETIQAYGVTVGCGRAQGLRPYVSYDYERADNSSPVRERAEYNKSTFGLGVRYVSPILGEIGVSASRQNVNVSQAQAAIGGADYRFNQVRVDFKREIGSVLTATARVGYGELDSDSRLSDGFKGVVWDVGLMALVGANTKITAGTGREVGNSLSSDATFVVTTPYRLRAEYAVNERIRFEVGGEIIERRFGYGLTPPILAITDERRRSIDAAVVLQRGNRINFRLFGGYERRNANGTLFDYSGSFVGASIGYRI